MKGTSEDIQSDPIASQEKGTHLRQVDAWSRVPPLASGGPGVDLQPSAHSFWFLLSGPPVLWRCGQ